MRAGAFSLSGRNITIEGAALNALSESNALRFIQHIALGVGAHVDAHVIVPTAMGMLLDDARDALIQECRRKSDAGVGDTLVRYDEAVFKRCAYCFTPLRADCKKPRQVVIHIVGGQLAAATSDDGWVYEIIFGLLCWRCQSVPWSSLLLVDEYCYVDFCSMLATYAFQKSLSLESFMSIHGNNAHDALADGYLWRIAQANAHSRDIVRALYVSDGDDAELLCYHCKRVCREGQFVACPGCAAVVFCSGIASPDTRLGKRRSCAELAIMYHYGLCQLISTNQLFHIDHAQFVTIEDGDVEALR